MLASEFCPDHQRFAPQVVTGITRYARLALTGTMLDDTRTSIGSVRDVLVTMAGHTSRIAPPSHIQIVPRRSICRRLDSR
jgi:hypothetical protein